ncbi:MAG: class II aldolase/adducin family protein [Actinobacteria bacterium]|nr:class II aldolase/adducin family protein [Actinomycetota bacterium]
MSIDPTSPPEDELRRDLVATAADLAALGLSPGASGNISVRLGERVLASPTGARLAALDPDGLTILDLAGNWVGGDKPTKESPLHTAIYRRDPSARAVIHLHSPNSVAAATLPPWSELSAIPPITPYFLMRVGQCPLVPYADPGDPALADALTALPHQFRAALLQNHGLVVWHATLDQAHQAAVELEETCRIWLAVAGLEPHLLSAETAARLAARHGTYWG